MAGREDGLHPCRDRGQAPALRPHLLRYSPTLPIAPLGLSSHPHGYSVCYLVSACPAVSSLTTALNASPLSRHLWYALRYWSRRGVPVVPTTNLLFGSTLELLRKGKIDFEAENLHSLGDTYG